MSAAPCTHNTDMVLLGACVYLSTAAPQKHYICVRTPARMQDMRASVFQGNFPPPGSANKAYANYPPFMSVSA